MKTKQKNESQWCMNGLRQDPVLVKKKSRTAELKIWRRVKAIWIGALKMGVWGSVAMQPLVMTLSPTQQAVGEVDQTVGRRQNPEWRLFNYDSSSLMAYYCVLECIYYVSPYFKHPKTLVSLYSLPQTYVVYNMEHTPLILAFTFECPRDPYR